MNKKEQQAIDFLRSMERDDLLSLGFSGGKDSVVILDLAERAGINILGTSQKRQTYFIRMGECKGL